MLEDGFARGTSRPLAGHALFASRDLDETREKVSAVFCPHRLDTIGRGAQLVARHHHLPGDRISLNYIEYGAKTLIAPGALERFYLVQIPLCGGASIANGAARYTSDVNRVAVLNPHRETAMIWAEGTAQLLLQIDRKAFMAHLSAQLGRTAERPLGFDGPMDVAGGAGAAFRRLVLFLVAEADQGRTSLGQGLMARQLETTLMAGLIEACGHDYAAEMTRFQATPRPRHLRLAEGYIESHLADQITVEDIAAVAGISVRGLQMVFRSHRGTSPLGFWRDMRLAQAHRALLAGDGSVTEVALKWGFGHFGRFSAMYRQKFGIAPSQTLRASRSEGYRD